MYRYLYRLVRWARPGKSLLRRYERELERNQWLSRDEIEEINWRKLKRLLAHAHENVPFYRQQFEQLGIMPEDIRTREDFWQLPLLSKEDIRENEDLLLAQNIATSKMKRTVTSGSTGVPFVTYQDPHFEAANIAAYARARRWYGWEFGDKVAWVWGRREEIPDTLKDKTLYRLKRERWMDGFHPDRERIQAFVEMLDRWKPDLIAGYANVIYLLAQYVVNQNMTGIRPKFIEPTAMKLWPHERQLIQQAFQCPISDRYGSHETGSIVVSECPEGSRHIFQDLCYLEILTKGQPALSNEPGEVVATPLHAFGMPLIRYRVGDVASFRDGQCDCGRGLPLLGEIEGRVTSIFTLPSGRLLYGGAFRHLAIKDSMAIKRFRVHQYSQNKIEVTLERGKSFNDQVVDLIRQRCLKLIDGEPVELTIRVTDEIPTTASGKHLVTTSDVPVQLN
jgi:phenylacetate-CoA ligase